jgi:thiamine-phosphate diphosphorylase
MAALNRLPRLHLVTDATVLGSPEFLGRARAIVAALGAGVALHLRGHGVSGGDLFRLAEVLAADARASGALLLVNDRIDVALAVGAGAHLGRRSLAPAVARRVLGADARIGYSAHSAPEVEQVAEEGADYTFFGTVYPSASHPGESTAGVEGVRVAARAATIPVIAIGGITPQRIAEVREGGAYGVAVLGGVWHADRPEQAAGRFHEMIEEVWR